MFNTIFNNISYIVADGFIGGGNRSTWCKSQANPDKFQAIAVGNKTHAKTPVFKIESAEIACDEVVKLLGIDIDYQLNFNYHIKNMS